MTEDRTKHSLARSSGPLAIRDIKRADFNSWLPLWDGYNEYYGRVGPTALSPEITRATWERFFDAYEPVYCMVAQDDDQLTGLVHYLFHRTTTAIEPNCYLQDLFTSPAMRGKGVGRKLIEAVYAKAQCAGITRIYWQTHESNTTARRLYDQVAEHSGFIVYRKLINPAL